MFETVAWEWLEHGARTLALKHSTLTDYRYLSRAGFDGGLDARILSSREETLRRHGPSEEVPR